MWRVLLLACLFALLGLATVAYADCTSCLTSVFTNRHGTEIDLNFVATSDDPSALPNSVTAVVMQVDGQRTKCQNITLSKVRNTEGARDVRGHVLGVRVVFAQRARRSRRPDLRVHGPARR